jgi:hypothetical protein
LGRTLDVSSASMVLTNLSSERPGQILPLMYTVRRAKSRHLFLYFSRALIWSTDFGKKKIVHIKFNKNPSSQDTSGQAERQTDRHDGTYSRFAQFCERA